MVVSQVLPCSVWWRLVAAQSLPELTVGPEDRKHRDGDQEYLCVSLQIGHGHFSWQAQWTFSYPGLGWGKKEILVRRALIFLVVISTGTKCFAGSLWKEVEGRGKFTRGRTTRVALRELETQMTTGPVWLPESCFHQEHPQLLFENLCSKLRGQANLFHLTPMWEMAIYYRTQRRLREHKQQAQADKAKSDQLQKLTFVVVESKSKDTHSGSELYGFTYTLLVQSLQKTVMTKN